MIIQNIDKGKRYADGNTADRAENQYTEHGGKKDKELFFALFQKAVGQMKFRGTDQGGNDNACKNGYGHL